MNPLNITSSITRILLPILLWAFWAPWAQAVVPQPGQQYPAGTVIEYPNAGVTYRLPDNAFGITSPNMPDAELIVGVLPHFQQQDNGVFVQIGSADFQKAVQQMNQRFLFMGAEFQPLGEASLNDGAVYNDFQYEDEGRQFRAFMLLISLDNGHSVLFVASAPENLITLYKQVIVDLAKSLSSTTQVRSQTAPEHNGSGGGERPYISQSQNGTAVIGKKCSYVSSGGMSFKLCD